MSDGDDVKTRLLEAAKPHVPFDGWSDATYRAAVKEAGVAPGLARAVFPRGAIDMALAYHEAGDMEMICRIEETDMSEMRFRDKVAMAVRLRLEAAEDKELVRRGMTLFALPHHAMDGAQAVWRTCDRIWTALGDSSDDVNWYTKRATLSAVYSSTVLYWLGDTSDGHQATWEFLDRRIDNVMQIEKVKAQVRNSPTLSKLMTGPNWLLSHVKAPSRAPKMGLPGSWTSPRR